MKHLILIGCLLLCIECYGQKKVIPNKIKPIVTSINPNGLMGIGILKMGTDSSILIEYAKANLDRIADPLGLETLEWRIKEEGGGKFKELLRLKYPEIKHSYCPDVTSYYLSQYEVSGVIIKNIYLKYYKGRLVEFKSDDSPDIKEALDVKYGKSDLTVERKKYSCMHNLTGISTPLEAKTFTNEWKNGLIHAISVLSQRYDDHCNEKYDSFFMVFVENKILDNCENEGLKNPISYPQRDKKILKDF
jgi:hypothetical protein